MEPVIRESYGIPTTDFDAPVRTCWQFADDSRPRPARAQGGSCRRDTDLGPNSRTKYPDDVVLLYAADGVLWGTLSPTVRADRAALRDYFVTAFKVLPSLEVTFGEQLIRVYGSTAVNTGSYTFSYRKDGQTTMLPARYSFTFVKQGEKWIIVDHHSSVMPATPP